MQPIVCSLWYALLGHATDRAYIRTLYRSLVESQSKTEQRGPANFDSTNRSLRDRWQQLATPRRKKGGLLAVAVIAGLAVGKPDEIPAMLWRVTVLVPVVFQALIMVPQSAIDDIVRCLMVSETRA